MVNFEWVDQNCKQETFFPCNLYVPLMFKESDSIPRLFSCSDNIFNFTYGSGYMGLSETMPNNLITRTLPSSSVFGLSPLRPKPVKTLYVSA